MTHPPFDHERAAAPPGGTTVWLHANDGVRLRAGYWPKGQRGTVFLLPGRTEFIEKYGAAATEFGQRGYAMVCLDWRGQGASDRLLPDPKRGHVRDFRDYQADMAAMIALAERQGLPRPWHLASHSMGGIIALRTLMGAHPFSTAVFSAPMWGLLLPQHLMAVAWGVSTLARATAQAHRLTPTANPECYLATGGFDGNVLTSDPQMFDWMKAQVLAQPHMRLGGPSLGWLNAALRECAALARRPAPAIPALTALGTAERVVDPAAVHLRKRAWPNGRLDLYPGAEHEIMMEAPAHRTRFFDSATDWFQKEV